MRVIRYYCSVPICSFFLIKLNEKYEYKRIRKWLFLKSLFFSFLITSSFWTFCLQMLCLCLNLFHPWPTFLEVSVQYQVQILQLPHVFLGISTKITDKRKIRNKKLNEIVLLDCIYDNDLKLSLIHKNHHEDTLNNNVSHKIYTYMSEKIQTCLVFNKIIQF